MNKILSDSFSRNCLNFVFAFRLRNIPSPNICGKNFFFIKQLFLLLNRGLTENWIYANKGWLYVGASQCFPISRKFFVLLKRGVIGDTEGNKNEFQFLLQEPTKIEEPNALLWLPNIAWSNILGQYRRFVNLKGNLIEEFHFITTIGVVEFGVFCVCEKA